MEKEIMNNIFHLYRSHIVTLVLFFLLGGVCAFVSIGVIKFGLIKSIMQRILLLIAVLICSIILLVGQILQVIPIYTDYKKSSYIVLPNATMTIITDSSGTIDRTNQVIVVDSNANHYDLKLQSDFEFDRGQSYTGTIVYLEHSRFVIWYSFDQ